MILALALAAAASNVPELPRDVPQTATFYDIQILDQLAGQMAAWTAPDGKLHVFYQFNDRGRGPKTYSRFTFDKTGIPTDVETDGNDYLKDPVHESFKLANGVAVWKNKAEQGSTKLDAPAFYASMFGPP